LNLKKRNNWKNGILRTIYIIPIYTITVNLRLQITILTLVVTTIALAPSLTSLISSHAQTTTTTTTTKIIKCEDEKGKSHTWITGCKDGWYNWNACGNGPMGTGQYDLGYAAGWKKGQQQNPGRVGCSNK
jgi:hypothetical protein